MIGQPLSELKRASALLWSLDVGRMHSRNNIVVVEDRAFLSSSGEQWNSSDKKDGVYCINLSSGAIDWFSPTSSDANEIAIIGNTLLVGTDAGDVFAFDADTGATISKIQTDSSVYVRAIDLEHSRKRTGILVSHAGDVIQYDCETRDFSRIGSIPFGIRANLAKTAPSSFLAGSDTGLVVLVEWDGIELNWRSVFEVLPHKATSRPDMLAVRGISSIVVSGDRVVVCYSRETYDRRPPIVCFSLRSGKKVWDAGRVQTASKTDLPNFGNSRVVPVIWQNLLISTFSYNNAVHAFAVDTGKWVWRQRLDDDYFQNWSSPIVHDGLLYVARINGVLSVLDLRTRKILSSYSVEGFDLVENASAVRHGDDPWPTSSIDLKSGPRPSQVVVAGICSTPAIWKGRILVGTVSGKLCCLNDENSRTNPSVD